MLKYYVRVISKFSIVKHLANFRLELNFFFKLKDLTKYLRINWTTLIKTDHNSSRELLSDFGILLCEIFLLWSIYIFFVGAELKLLMIIVSNSEASRTLVCLWTDSDGLHILFRYQQLCIENKEIYINLIWTKT